MKIKLTHLFITRCIDPEKLLKNCSKFDTFCSRLERQATEKATLGNGEIDQKVENKYKGDGFELFVEMFIKCFGADTLIQVYPDTYVPIDEGIDYGVDGKSVGDNKQIHTFQIKYRQSNYELTANEDNLTNFTSLSMMPINAGGFGVDPNYKCPSTRKRITGKANMTIIHCGKKIHYTSADRMLYIVREINRQDIKNKVNDNNIFWDSFLNSWIEELKNIKNS